jgi:hypothetical protein
MKLRGQLLRLRQRKLRQMPVCKRADGVRRRLASHFAGVRFTHLQGKGVKLAE